MSHTSAFTVVLALLLASCAGSTSSNSAADSSDDGAALAASAAALSVALGTDCSATAAPDGAVTGNCGNGCHWLQKPGGYPLLFCPEKPKPICNQPADASQHCWDPPKQVCGSSGAVATYGCSADGSMCCHFSSTCQPCGWVDCDHAPTGQAVPAACQAPHGDPQWTAKCPVGLQEQMHCEVCAGALICLPGAPTEIVAH